MDQDRLRTLLYFGFLVILAGCAIYMASQSRRNRFPMFLDNVGYDHRGKCAGCKEKEKEDVF